MSDKLQKFKEVLREIFQLDQAELDFGIYRIMNQKRDDIERFLDKDLLTQVNALFNEYYSSDNNTLVEELQAAVEQAKSLGFDPNVSPKVIELRAQLSSVPNKEELAQNVFSYLSSFFKRYYDNGDFLSQRRYKKDVYAIPYEGEEVKLFWANYDQYYIKTTEYFKNYSFKLSNSKKINFQILEATTEQNNNVASKAKERKFFIDEENPLSLNNDNLNINFRYDFNDKKQKDLNRETYTAIELAYRAQISQIPSLIEFMEIFDLRPTDKNKSRTLIEKHLQDFTARNTFDYFIHKDLGGFLRRELDFYIKNEVLYIDDINELDEKQFHKQVSTIKVMKQIGHKIIAFLEQLENFQKKLWLKKKFVVETNYCITLDRVPKDLYPEIIENKKQIDEWKKLFAIDEIHENLTIRGYSESLTCEFLEQNQFLLLDTYYFSDTFKNNLIKSIIDFDQQLDGLLIHSENFQALNLLSKRYRGQVKCSYIDPPYNAKSSEILYKNTFKHSSWITLIENRLIESLCLLKNNSVSIIAIDEVEQTKLGELLRIVMPEKETTAVTIVHNPSGQQGDNFSYTNEFAYFIYDSHVKNIIGKALRDDEGADVRTFRDNSGNNNLRSDAANCFYPIFVKNSIIVGFGDVCKDEFHPNSKNIQIDDGIIAIYPIDNNGIEKKWVFAKDTVTSILGELWVNYDNKKNEYDIMRTKKIFRYKTTWTEKKYSANSYGSAILNDILYKTEFSYPKSIHTVSDCVKAGLSDKLAGLVLDYFAGSGTTGHAVINLNREDNGKRKYILVEMGEYFDTVTKPRIQKVIYSKDWKDGKPVSREGISHCFKYIRLESYEDTLNNLQLIQTQPQQQTLALDAEFREGYMLSYMLDVESEGSASLLNLEQFEDPFNYYLNITRDNETKPTKIDLVETFNYLLGLVVETIDELDGFRLITGKLLNSEKVLVIWRNKKEKTNEELNNFFSRIRINIKDSEFDRIYVNGDNFLENMKIGEEKWKVGLIEEEFKKLMFEGT